jgi:NAD(P)H-flavin reductase
MATCPLDLMRPQPYRLSRVRRETHDIFRVEFEPMASDGGFSFALGQFIMLSVFGVGEVPIPSVGILRGVGPGWPPPSSCTPSVR